MITFTVPPTEAECEQVARYLIQRGYSGVTVMSSTGDPCKPCNGSGTVDDVNPATGKVRARICQACSGTGRV